MTKSFSAAVAPLLITALLIMVAVSTGVAQTPWPTEQWPATTPEAVGLSSATLDSIDAEIRAGDYGYVDRFLVIRNGQLAYDRRYRNDYDRIYGDSARVGTLFLNHHRAGPYNYFNPWWHPYYRRGDLHTLQSVTKTVTSTAIGAAVTRDEFPSLDTPVLSFFDSGTAANVDDRKRRMTVRHLLTMTAGLDWDEEGAVLGEEGTVDALESSYDWVQFTIDRPMAEEPGTRFNYNSGASQLLSHIFHKATGSDIEEYAARHLFAPLGIDDWFWKRTPAGLPDTEGGLYLTSEDLAKLWLLFLRDGTWDGQEVVSPDWVRASVAPAIAVHDPVRPSGVHYGLKWWLHPNPTDSTRFMWLGSGFGGQFPIAIPEQDLIIVINQWNILPSEPWLIPEPIVARILRGITDDRRSGFFPSAAPDVPDAKEVPVTVPDLGVRVAVEEIAPVVPVRADGDFHLFYELRLTGFDPRVLRLENVEVLDGDSAPGVLASYGPTELKEMIESPGPGGGDPTPPVMDPRAQRRERGPSAGDRCHPDFERATAGDCPARPGRALVRRFGPRQLVASQANAGPEGREAHHGPAVRNRLVPAGTCGGGAGSRLVSGT
ncbi:MAG TPA: serine hydrolase [Longimicrobiales bacterium]|nr:serine hydrolase [Longimicrobiales bacterium]